MAVPIPHISCTWDISCTSFYRFSGSRVFSHTCSCKALHPSLSRASCLRGHLLLSNLSPFVTVPVTPLRNLGGRIPGLVRSDKTWNHLHHSPLNMSFICPEDISCSFPLKIALFTLALAHCVLPAPMGKILLKGRTISALSQSRNRANHFGQSFELIKPPKVLSSSFTKWLQVKWGWFGFESPWMGSSLPPFHGSFQVMKPNPLLLGLTLSLPFPL